MLRLLGLSSAEASSKCIDDTRSLVKAAANAKATFDAAYVTAESDSLKYWEWLKDNKETTGDYFSTAPTFQRELEQCNMLYSMGQPNSN